MSKPIDLARVRRADDNLKALARDHPEAFDLERLPTNEKDLATVMGRPKKDPKDVMQPVMIRLPQRELDLIDQMVVEANKKEPHRIVTKGEILREMIYRGWRNRPKR